MEAHGWRSNRPLSRGIRESYAHFNFYQLVRLLLRERGIEDPDGRNLDAAVRFRADLSAAFPGNEVTRLEDRGAGAPIAITTPNYVVAGYLGPLPEPFTDWLRDAARDGDHVLANFLDLFNHRVNALRYRCKVRNQIGLSNSAPENTPHARSLAAAMGMDAPGLAEQLPIPRRALLGAAGLLADVRKSEPVVTAILSLYLKAKVSLRSLCGGWRFIGRSDRNALGARNSRLGRDSVLGAHVWDASAGVEITVGPLPYERYCRLLPDERGHDERYCRWPRSESRHEGLVALLRFLTDRRFDCSVRLIARPHTLPDSRLQQYPDNGTQSPGYWGLRLGQTAWLAGHGARRYPRQVRDAVFVVPAFVASQAAS